ncbi:hypothetical protein BH23CHL2_BH23CHL2_07340 [soil metagenome]
MSDDRRHNRDDEINRPTAELISAYLNDWESLSSQELERLELLLDEDQDAQRIHAELRVITRELGNLDHVPAPRSYHLDAEMVGAPEPVVLQETSAWYAHHAQTVRWATAAAAILFVFVLGADLVVNGVFFDTGDDDVFETNQAEMTSRQADDDNAEAGASDAEESAGDDAGAGEDAPAALVPESAGDDDAAPDEPDSDISAMESAPSEEDQGGASAEPEAGDGALTAIPTPAIDESASGDRPFAVDQAQLDADGGDSDRRLWRIAQFSLVVLLGLLITAMVVLPRLGNGTTRTRNGE